MSLLVGQDELIGRVLYLQKLQMVDVVRFHGLVPQFQTQNPVRVRLRLKSIEVPGFEKRSDAAGKKLSFLNVSFVGVNRWTRAEDRLEQRNGSGDRAGTYQG